MDADPATGGEFSWDPQRKGREARLTLSTGLDLVHGGTRFTQRGDIESDAGTHTVAGVVAACDVERGADASGSAAVRTGGDADRTTRLARIEGRRLIAEVPYELVGARPGDKVRVCFVDRMEDSFPPEKISRPGTPALD